MRQPSCSLVSHLLDPDLVVYGRVLVREGGDSQWDEVVDLLPNWLPLFPPPFPFFSPLLRPFFPLLLPDLMGVNGVMPLHYSGKGDRERERR